MEHFLICENTACLFIIDLKQGGRLMSRSELVISQCPECGHRWSPSCPFCMQPLDITWNEKLPHCSRCLRKLQPKVVGVLEVPGD
jgi:hypothetical protein